MSVGFNKEIGINVIKQAKNGDQSSLESIYLFYIDTCYSLIFRMTYSHSYSEDLVQDVFIKVFKNIQRYNFSGSFSSWIKKIAINETINFLKNRYQTSTTLDDIKVSESASQFNFEKNYIDIETLDKWLKKLTPTQRSVMILYELEGYTHKEIAKFFSKSESFSKMTLQRAYLSLQLAVQQEESLCI